MYFHRLPARQWGLATVVGLAALAGQVQAQIQAPAPASTQALDDGSTSTFLKLDGTGSRNYFVRFGYTYIKPNTKAGNVYDVTGPAVGYQQALRLVQQGKLKGTNGVTCTPNGTQGIANPPYKWGPNGATGSSCRNIFGVEAEQLDGAMLSDGVAGIGIPPVLNSEAVGAGTFTIQVGVFLDDDHKWTAEPFIFGVPFENKVYVKGNNAISGQLAITTQQLPLTVILNRYFGDKNSRFRPSIGIGGTYAIFFNTETTAALNDYAGGVTDAKIKNAFGYGPFVGMQVKLADRWHLSAQLGYVKLKTSATLTTHDTKLVNNGEFGAVVTDFTKIYSSTDKTVPYYNTAEALCSIMGCDSSGVPIKGTQGYNNAAAFLKAIQDANGGSLGTFTRRQDVNLDPYVFTLGLGYEF